MARIAVAQLHDGDSVEQAFVITGKQIATTANSKLYIKADCSDATGQGSHDARVERLRRDMYGAASRPRGW